MLSLKFVGRLLPCVPASFLARSARAQVSMSSGANYVQHFNALANTGTGRPWTNNATLPGWQAEILQSTGCNRKSVASNATSS